MAGNNEQYIIPIGLDSNEAAKGLDEIIGKLEETQQAATDAGKTLGNSLKEPAEEADRMNKALEKVNKKLEETRAEGVAMGKDLANALASKDGLSAFEKTMNGFKKKLNEIGKNKIGIDVDSSKLDILNSALAETSGEINEVRAALAQVETVLQSLDPNSEEFLQLAQAVEYTRTVFETFDNEVEVINSGMNNLDATFEEVYGDLQPLTTRLGELEDRMYELALAGGQNTEEFKQLQKEAIRYRQTIQQVDAAVDTFAKRSAILDITVEAAQGLTGAFAAAQGAAALFGEENEEVEKALLKVNAAMSILQGIQAVAAVLNKDSAVSALLMRNNLNAQAAATTTLTTATQANTVATTTATVASRAFGFALKALGIGLIIGLIAFLVENWDKLTAAVNKFLPAGASVGSLFDKIKSYAMGVGNAILQYLVTPFRALTSLLTGDFQGFKDAITKGFSFKANFQKGFNDQELRNEKAHQLELEKTRIEADARDLQRRKNRGENVAKEEQALQKRRIAILEAGSKEQKEAQTALEDMEDASYKERQDKANEAAKKRLEDQKKNQEQAAEAAKKNQELITQYTRAYEDSQTALMEEGLEKRKKQLQIDYTRRIEDLKKETGLSAAALVERNKLIAQLEAELKAEQVKATTEYNKEQLNLRMEAERQILELSKDTQAKELALLEQDKTEMLAEIRERYKDNEELRIKLEAALLENVERERKTINKEYAEQRLEEEEKSQILLVELSSKYAVENEKTERQKQIAILNVKLEYAKKALAALVASGEAENSIAVLQAKKVIQDIQDDIKDETEKGEGFSWFDFLGLGDLSGKDQQNIAKAFNAFKQSVSQITDFIVDQYDRQIEKKQEVIDQLDDEIGDIEKRLDAEKALQEKGLANNVEAIEKELAAKQAQKDEEIRQQEELQEKKQNLQRAQLVVDSIVQAANLATAATEIFKSLAGIPFVGVPLAIAAIGAMIGAFAVSKVKAAQAINSQSFGDGGWIDGAPHSRGGVKYYSADGKNIELEGDEYVVKKSAMRKYGDVVEAINEDDLGGLGAFNTALQMLLKDAGISLFTDKQESALKDAQITNNLKVYVNNSREAQRLEDISRNIAYLAQQKREEAVRWEDDFYIYIKKGSKTTKIKKSDGKI